MRTFKLAFLLPPIHVKLASLAAVPTVMLLFCLQRKANLCRVLLGCGMLAVGPAASDGGCYMGGKIPPLFGKGAGLFG